MAQPNEGANNATFNLKGENHHGIPTSRVTDDHVGQRRYLATHDMSRAVQFYRALGFALHDGGEDASFTSFHSGRCHLNLIAKPRSWQWSWWGRIIFYVSDVDAMPTPAKNISSK
jgi:hypothetical protein